VKVDPLVEELKTDLKLFRLLDSLGGLGLDKHDWIRDRMIRIEAVLAQEAAALLELRDARREIARKDAALRAVRSSYIDHDNVVKIVDAALRPAKCDGDHELPRCGDPECWQDEITGTL
jgi:hypothetical protein